MKPETVAIHAPARRRDGEIAPAIRMTTTFEHGPSNELIHGYLYQRHANPNVDDLEARLAAIEGGRRAVAFTTGMAAAAAMLATMRAGERAVFHDDLYFDVKTLAREELAARGGEAVFADLGDEAARARALADPAALVWIETPSNPRLDVVDIAAAARASKKAGAKLVVDGTFATPALQRPLDLGADYVLHSMTKYMGGHSDVQGGAIIVRDGADADALFHARKTRGAALAPFAAWLISRGLQTLYVRMERHCANAAAIAAFLDSHPRVERARYPFLGASADIARRQMRAGGGMVSFDVKGGLDAALHVASRLKLFTNATSLGGVESLVEHRASLEGPDSTTPDGLLRLSVGLEHADDLIADLKAALAA